MKTSWSMMEAAHRGPSEEQRAARQWLVERYQLVVRCYLQGAVARTPVLHRDPNTVDDLVGIFVCHVMAGKFCHADSQGGGFRHYLKKTLSHMIKDHIRKTTRKDAHEEQLVLDTDGEVLAEGEEEAKLWRLALLSQALERLQREDQGSPKKKYRFVVLMAELNARLAVPLDPSQLFSGGLAGALDALWGTTADHVKASSKALAVALTPVVGKSVCDVWVRKNLERARERLAQHLVDLVVEMQQTHSTTKICEELCELGLYEHCKRVL